MICANGGGPRAERCGRTYLPAPGRREDGGVVVTVLSGRRA